jgi:hypothetical protein
MKITHPMSRVKCILHSTFFILHFGKADILLPSPFGEGLGVRLGAGGEAKKGAL